MKLYTTRVVTGVSVNHLEGLINQTINHPTLAGTHCLYNLTLNVSEQRGSTIYTAVMIFKADEIYFTSNN